MKKTLSILTFMVMTVTLLAQTTLTFVGRDRTGNDYVRLSSVSVYDLDQLWHQIIEYPDTTLVLYVNGTVGVETMCTSSLQMQNNPNPFDGATDVILCTPYAGDVTMEIADVNGRAVVGANNYSPQPGTHQFRLTLSAPGTYVLTARQNGRTVSVKMVNAGNGGGDGIEYIGSVETVHAPSLQLKSNARGDGHYPFLTGDQMRYTGYAVVDDVEIESEEIEQRQYYSETIPLKFDVARPEVVTNDATNVAATAAMLHGEVTADNNANVTERGFCYGTGNNPNLNGTHVAVGDGVGTFSTQVDGLTPATNYKVRAYATNMVGTSYGQQKTFRTMDTLPVVITAVPSNITATVFTSGGEVTAMNSASLTSRGVCWNTTGTPTIADSHTTQNGGLGSFTSNVTGLDCSTTYYVRAYATNGAGTAYGEEYSVTTLPSSIPDAVLSSSAIYNGLNIVTQAEVLNENCAAVTARGVCWSTSHNPTITNDHTTNGEGIGIFYDTITNLEVATTYYVRAYATNSAGTNYSEEIAILTPTYPSVTTATVSNVTYTTSTSGGNVTSDGSATVTARGVCWSTSHNPTISDSHTTDGNGLGSFTSSLTGLTAGTTYYVRAYATNSVGTAYGNEVNFATAIQCGTYTLTDIDGNTYNTVLIGNQCWMKENLRTTHYADNTAIPAGSTTSFTEPYRYAPNNNESNVETYGYLYNWAAVMHGESSSNVIPSGVQGICPTGWHVPSDAEWTQLTNYVSSQSQYVCGNDNTYIAKALASTMGWNSSNTTCAVGNTPSDNNATGFSVLPAGFYNGNSGYLGYYAYFWSATGINDNVAWYRYLGYNNANVNRNSTNKNYGFSVRCVHDEDEGQGGRPCSDVSTLTDIDGNTYNTVRIGYQCWMKENLRTTHYADNTEIPVGSTTSDTEPYRYAPNNDESNVSSYGYLYNWAAVMHGASSSNAIPSGVQGICPTGWHVPSDAEWTQLTDYVSSQSQYVCGNDNTYIAKALASTMGWNSSNATCTVGEMPYNNNATGFTALPAGVYSGDSYSFGGSASFWSATEHYYDAWYRELFYVTANVRCDYTYKYEGSSVRCVRD